MTRICKCDEPSKSRLASTNWLQLHTSTSGTPDGT
jgi:hypothetical protein